MVLCKFRQDRRKGNGTEVLVNIIDGPLFWDRDYISSFQDGGRQDSWNEELRITETGHAKRSAFSFNNHIGMPSGPCALVGLSADSFLKVENSDIVFTA